MGATAGTRDPGGLVGRVAERARLDAALAALRAAAAARVLAVSGEPGIGKSRLLRELETRAREQRATVVLHGRAAEFEDDLPFGVLIDALDEHLGGLDRSRLRNLDGLAELAAVFPALAGSAPGPPGLAAERYRVHRAVRGLLERIAATRPLVLVLDDLHWADPASLEVVAALLRRPPAARILIAIAYRSGRLEPRAAEAVTVAERDGHLERLHLAPLSRNEAEPLLAPFAGPVRDAVFGESGGNPFYLEQLLRAPRRVASTN